MEKLPKRVWLATRFFGVSAAWWIYSPARYHLTRETRHSVLHTLASHWTVLSRLKSCIVSTIARSPDILLSLSVLPLLRRSASSSNPLFNASDILIQHLRHIIHQVPLLDYTPTSGGYPNCFFFIISGVHFLWSDNIILILAQHQSWQLQLLVHLEFNSWVLTDSTVYQMQMKHMFKCSGNAIYVHTFASLSLGGLIQARQPSLRRFVV